MKTIQVSENIVNAKVNTFNVTNALYSLILSDFEFYRGFRRINIALYDEPKKAKNQNADFLKYFRNILKMNLCAKIN